MFKSLLKQYLDGISVNDDVMNSNNPLVVNHKINLANIESNEAIVATIISILIILFIRYLVFCLLF